VGEELRLVPAPDATSGTWSLNAGAGAVAHLRFGHDGWALDVARKEEHWQIAKHGRFGRELNLERHDGALLGTYQGRRWRSGGSVELADKFGAELRRSLLRNNHWRIKDLHGPVCEIRSCPANQLSLFGARSPHRMIVAVAPEVRESVNIHLVVLSACGVIMLTDALAAASAKADLGR
jgi:hypothetical protein